MAETTRSRQANGITLHPLDPDDAPITAAMRAAVSASKGVTQGIGARGQFDAFMEIVSPRDDVTFDEDTIGGIPGLWVHPANPQSKAAVLHLHGGWFNFGSARAYRHLVGHIAARAGARAFIPDYRLAPEHPFPAATDDVLACYRGLAEKDIQRVALTGDSAGGNLALGLASRITAEGTNNEMLVGVALMSPVTDLSLSGAVMRRARTPIPFSPVRRSQRLCVPTSKGLIRKTLWRRRSSRNFPTCRPSAFTLATTRCCSTTRWDLSSARPPPAPMPGPTCGWECHTDFQPASEG